MRKLRNIFILAIFICLVLIIFTSTVIAYNLNRQAAEEQSVQLLETKANYTAEKIDKKLLQFEAQLKTLESSFVAHYKSLDLEGIPLIEHMLKDFDEIISIVNEKNRESVSTYIVMNNQLYPNDDSIYRYQVAYVKDEAGNNIKNSDLADSDTLDLKTPSMAWYSKPLAEKKGIWSNIYYDRFVKATIITYSMPIMVNGEAIGIIGIDLQFSEIASIINTEKVYETGYLFLMNDNYDYLVHPVFDSNDNLTEIYEGSYAYMKPIFDASNSGVIKYYFNNQDKIMAFKHLSNDWVVAAAPPYEEVFYFYNDLRNTQILFMIIGSLISMIIAGFLGHLISKPFIEISQDIESYEVKDIQFVRKNHFIYEVDILYKNFNGFIERLKEAFHNIQNQNLYLEEIVKDRTLDLETSNRKLLKSISELESTQNELVNAKKDREVNILIKNIAHNLNTPLGSAIMTYSYLDQLVTDSDKPKVLQAMNIINNNLYRIKRIVDGLNMLTSDYKMSTISSIPLYLMFNDRIQWLRSQFTSLTMDIDVDINHDYQISCYKNMFINLLDVLLSYSLQNYDDINLLKLDIKVIKNMDTFTFTIIDYQIPVKDMIHFYDHNNLSDMNMSLFNLDLHLLHAIITALKGEIRFESTWNNYVRWIVILPIENKNKPQD